MNSQIAPLPPWPYRFFKAPRTHKTKFQPPLNTSSYPPSSYYQFFMSIFTPNIEEAKLYVQIFRPLAQCALSLKSRFIRERLSGRWVVAYESLKTKEKSSWVIPKVVAVTYWSDRLRELFIIKFNSLFKLVFTNVVVTRAGRLREWSQEELRLCNCTHERHHTSVIQ